MTDKVPVKGKDVFYGRPLIALTVGPA